jgi:predicted nucleotide-binding protein
MNINDKPLSFNVNGKEVNSFSTLEEARKAAVSKAGNEVIVEKTEQGIFNYKGKSTFEVHEVTDVNPAEIKDNAEVSGLAKGINAIEFIFDKNNDSTKTSDEIYAVKEGKLSAQKEAGSVFAFNTSELGKGTIRVVKNDDKNFAFAFSIKDTPDIAGFESVQKGVKDFLHGFIDSNTFADGDPDDERMLKNQLSNYLNVSVDKSFMRGHFPEITVSLNKQTDGSYNMSLLTDWPIAGLTDKELNKLNITTAKDGKTVIPFGNVKITTDLGKAANPSLAMELLATSYKPINIPLKRVGDQYSTDDKTLAAKTDKAFSSLSTSQNVEITTGATWIGSSKAGLSVSAAYRHDIKDYAAVKFNWGGQVDVMPTTGQFQATPTLGANVTALKYFGVPLSLNVDVGPSLGNMRESKDFSLGIKTGTGLKYNVTDNVDVGINYSHVFGIKGESQNAVGATVGIKF